ncbi:MAG: hypothetical protein ABIJ57_02675 [Pseudomonadota bacterium]
MTVTQAWDETTPADADSISAGAGVIRTHVQAIRERIAIDHYMAGSGTDTTDGEHVKITFHVQSAKPTAVANKGFLYTKDDAVTSKVELFWEDEDGTELQLTSAGAVAVGSLDGDALVIDYSPTNYTAASTALDDHLDGINTALASNCRIATGTYTGDGSTGQAITGVGFAPKYLKIWKLGADGAGAVIFEKSDTSGWGTLAVKHANIALVISNADNAIISLDADGFTVDDAGSDQNPNANGETYHFLALG